MSILLGAHRTPSLIHCQKDMEERRKYALYCCLSLICSRSSLSKITVPDHLRAMRNNGDSDPGDGPEYPLVPARKCLI